MTEKVDIEKAIRDEAEQFSEQLANSTEIVWQRDKLAMELAEKKRLAKSPETQAANYQKRLSRLSNAEFNRRAQFNDWENLDG